MKYPSGRSVKCTRIEWTMKAFEGIWKWKRKKWIVYNYLIFWLVLALVPVCWWVDDHQALCCQNDFVKFTFEWISPHIIRLNDVVERVLEQEAHAHAHSRHWHLTKRCHCHNFINDFHNKDIMYLRLFHFEHAFFHYIILFALAPAVYKRVRRSRTARSCVVLSFHMVDDCANWRGENYKRMQRPLKTGRVCSRSAIYLFASLASGPIQFSACIHE